MNDLLEAYHRIDRTDTCVLSSIFRNMWDFEYVPLHAIIRDCAFKEDRLELILKKLSSMGIVENKYDEYLGTRFTFKGLSVFSLKRLVMKGIISKMGNILGEGKESVVFNALNDKNEELAVKFHRVGYPSFKKVREKRNYGTLHVTVLTVRSAKREYSALKRLYGYVSVPEPIFFDGNAVVSRLIDARELYRVRLKNPEEVLEMIIDEVRKMYHRGVIHGDLSQFNILANQEGIWIIDFPQYADVWSPHSDEILKRDVSNIIDYFDRSYGVKKDLNEVLNYVRGRA